MQGYSVLSPLDISLLLVLVGAALLELCDKVSGKDGGGGPGGIKGRGGLLWSMLTKTVSSTPMCTIL